MRTSMFLIAGTFLLGGVLVAQTPNPKVAGTLGFLASAPQLFSQVDYPGALQTFLYGENNRGITTGAFQNTGEFPHAFIIDHGSFQALDPSGLLGQNNSYALTCNDLGVVVGQWATPDWTVSHGFIWQNGKVTTTDYPGNTFTAVYGINDLGTLIGIWTDASGLTQGYLCHQGKFEPLTGNGLTSIVPYSINNLGTLVGQLISKSDSQYHAFLRTPEGGFTLFDYPGAVAGSTVAISINDLGVILGYYALADGSSHGFYRIGAKYFPLDYPGSTITVTQTINDFGRIVGYFNDAAGLSHGFTTMPDLF